MSKTSFSNRCGFASRSIGICGGEESEEYGEPIAGELRHIDEADGGVMVPKLLGLSNPAKAREIDDGVECVLPY
jgi:hypothetical protein